MTDNEMIARAKQVFAVEIEGLEKTRDSLGASFVRAVRLMLDTVADGGIVVVTGVGKNLHIAEKMSAIFSSTGTRSIVLNPVQAMHGDLGMVSAKDVLLALSFSGESAEVNNLIPAIRRHGLKVISMTGRADSTLAQMSDIHIEIPCGKEACPFGMAPTNSTTATMAMGDALAMVMIDAQKFPVEDYAMNHPAGAIGRALVMRVSDIMRTGERLAKVGPDATVLDALMAMTNSKGGSAVVAAADGKLLGIFTDGDFRRIMSERVLSPSAQASDTILNDPISRYMTKSPLFVYDDVYAAELLKIFEKRRIDDLPVCDRSGRVVGLVDIQDLPKMKVL
ncbi:MAG: KpsF/GutQ family sugar-phosphate isomerase [Kiritimatiellae bacterium]|nr:KpsF/GutQ family sugar-phosphate isomerase [Kiritimatiellia bacterium]